MNIRKIEKILELKMQKKDIFNLNKRKLSKHNILPKCRLKRLSQKEINNNKSLFKKYRRNDLTLAGVTEVLWLPNSTLKVGFDFSGYCVPARSKDELSEQIINVASEWSKHGSINLEISKDHTICDIVIAFNPYIGTFSYLGTASKIPIGKGKYSMNIDPSWSGNIWNLDKEADSVSKYFLQSAVLHEFGHAFGLEHEHQREDRPFTWDIAWMKENIDKLGLDTWKDVVFNYINTTPMSALTYGEYDFKSIMSYEWVKNATIEKIKCDTNFELSNQDKQQFGILYP